MFNELASVKIFCSRFPINIFWSQPNNPVLLAGYDTSHLLCKSSIKIFMNNAKFPNHVLTSCFSKMLKQQNTQTNSSYTTKHRKPWHSFKNKFCAPLNSSVFILTPMLTSYKFSKLTITVEQVNQIFKLNNLRFQGQCLSALMCRFCAWSQETEPWSHKNRQNVKTTLHFNFRRFYPKIHYLGVIHWQLLCYTCSRQQA